MPLAAVLLPLLLVLGASPACQGQGQGAAKHNITAILAAHPDFTDFSAALVSTGAATEIDHRTPITVLAVDNAAMARLRAQKPQPDELVRVIYLQVLLEYLDAAKLGSIQGGFAQLTSLYQATGKAPGSEGIVNVTVFRDGRVAAFTPSEPSNRLPTAFYLRSIKEMPYDIAVLQVRYFIWSPAPADGAQAPAPAPAPQPSAAPEFTDLLSKNGCGGFAALLAATADAVAAYDRSAAAAAGLTVFCPADKALDAFNSTFKNLTADARLAVLLYHGVAAHYSAQSLKAIDGDVGTLATGASKNHGYNLTVRADGDTVKLSSAGAAATVTKTLLDKAPLAVYLIDAVLLPTELSNGGGQGRTTAPAPAPASSPAHAPAPALAPPPAPAPVSPPPAHAHAPAPTPPLAPVPAAAPPTHRRRPAPSPEDTTPAPSPDEDGHQPADQKNNGARDTASWTLGAAVATAAPAAVAIVFLLW